MEKETVAESYFVQNNVVETNIITDLEVVSESIDAFKLENTNTELLVDIDNSNETLTPISESEKVLPTATGINNEDIVKSEEMNNCTLNDSDTKVFTDNCNEVINYTNNSTSDLSQTDNNEAMVNIDVGIDSSNLETDSLTLSINNDNNETAHGISNSDNIACFSDINITQSVNLDNNGSNNILNKNEDTTLSYEVTRNFKETVDNFNHSRKVKFPNDGNLVSGYLDPPNPWNEGDDVCSTEQLVCEYKAACDLNSVKPFPHVLEQLRGIDLSVCNDRYDMLSLRNLKLDHRHMESLEAILKRVQFKTLDFENTGLEDESAIALFDMIEYYESCCKLNIGANSKIGLRGWQTCSRMLKKTSCLIVLDLHSIAITEQSMPALVRSLRVNSRLVMLHLEQCNISGRNLLILVTGLRTNDSLRELLLADNKMVSTDGQHLCSLLKSTPTLQLLDLRNNNLQDTGCCQICEGLFEQNGDHGLASLILWHNQITDASMSSFSIALGVHRHLQTLNLGHNTISSEGVHLLKDGLLRNRSLLRLGLQACRINCEGAVALAEFLAESQRLIRLDLRDTQVKTAGLMALKLALSVNKTLTRLDLDRESKKEPTVRDYAEQQQALLNVITDLLQRNKKASRDLEMKQLDEQQLMMEREETSSQDSLQRPSCLDLAPPDLTMSDIDSEVAPDLLQHGRFISITSPSDKVLNDFSAFEAQTEPIAVLCEKEQNEPASSSSVALTFPEPFSDSPEPLIQTPITSADLPEGQS